MRSLVCLLSGLLVLNSQAGSARPLIELVDTRIGGGGIGTDTGCVNPGAQVPYGAMRLGPDTTKGEEPYRPQASVSCGYQYQDPELMCFSHTHLVGAGVSDFQNFGVTIVREIDMDRLIKDDRYGSAFSHESEVSVPGYYGVTLDKWNARAELTVGGTHAGVHRYTCWSYDQRQCTALFDICHSSWWLGPNGACEDASIDTLAFDANRTQATLTAWVFNFGGFSFMGFKGIQMYFKATVEAHGAISGRRYPFLDKGVPLCWMNNELSNASSGVAGCRLGESTISHSLGALFTVDTGGKSATEDIVVTVRTSLSFISADNAARLLETQLQSANGTWMSFDEVRSRTQAVWEETLGRVEVDVGAVAGQDDGRQPLTSYYSSLYRAHLAPTTYTEFGTYLSENQKMDTVPDSSYAFLSDLSIWDIFRTQMPLTMILEPQVARNTGWSMLQMYRETGTLPVWVLFNMETNCMVGHHSAVILSDFVRKGLKHLNTSAIFDAVVTGIRAQNKAKMGTGPEPYHPYVDAFQYGSGSDTLDFAVDAAAVRNLALFLGNQSIAVEFEPYAEAWRNIWNPERQIFCPKTENGTWVCPNRDYRPNFQQKYREDNAGEYRWFVPQNLTGLVRSFNRTSSTHDDYAQTLNDMFVWGQLWPENSEGKPDWWFWAGNEPDMMTPMQFPSAGNQYGWLTDKWVAATLSEYYQPSPTYKGLPGNDDYGTLSSFEFFAFSGIYPISSTNSYVLTTPWFVNSTFHVAADQATFSPFSSVASPSGSKRKILQIRAHGHPGTAKLWKAAAKLNGVKNDFYYIANATINGIPLTGRVFTQEQLHSNLQEGEVVTIDVFLVSEPVVFGAATPGQGGPKPFIPTLPSSLNITTRGRN